MKVDWKMSEKLPISDFYKVVDFVTIFRSKKQSPKGPSIQ